MRRAALPFFLLLTVNAFGASAYPPKLRWQSLTTEHFYVHFHQEEEALARRAAAYAERAHERLTPLIGWTPRERTHLILTDHVDVSNGSATPFPSNRIEIYVSAPGADPSSAIEYYDNWLNLVITHEYAHILHLDQARGFSAVMRKAFGRNPVLAFPNEWSPLWLIEGLATLAESEVTDTGRLKGTFVDMVLRTAAVENRFASEAQASGLGSQWPVGHNRYFYGAKFLSWLATTKGADKLTRYLAEYSSNIPFRVNATAKDVYGTSMKLLWRQWSEDQQRAYRAERDQLAAAGLTERRKLTTLGYETRYPILSPDGTRIAYLHHGPYERPTIRVRDVATNQDVATHAVNSGSALSWSADGRSLAYSDLEFVGSFSLLSDLYVWEIGGDTRRITRGARMKDPAFTPEGSLIAVENRVGRNRLVEVDVASGAVRALVEPTDMRQFSEPAVSHGGRSIAVAEWQNGTIDVVTYDRKGARLANLTESFVRATNASPRFSGDDRTIWFSSDITGVPNLYSVEVGGGTARRLTNLYGGAFYPTSADGRTFFYSDYSSEGFDLATFSAGQQYPTVPRVIPPTVMGNAAPLSNAIETTDVTTPAKPYSAWQSLRPRWWFPILGAESGGETTLGFTTSGGDVLGHHTYTATVTNRDHGIIYSYDRLYPTLTFAALRYEDHVLTFVSPTSSRTYTETTQRFVAQAAVPWRTVQRQATFWGGLIRDTVGGDIPSGISTGDLARFGVFRGTLQGIRAGATFNNAHEYLRSISPEQGITASLAYENLNKALGSEASLQQFRGDLRGYLAIPYRRSPTGRHVVAFHGAAARTTGDFVFQRSLKVGGESIGDTTTLELTNLPVRGYESATLRGRTAAIASAEYRFPIYDIDRGPTTWPIFFKRVHGDVFVDAGRAWQQIAGIGRTGTIASTGAEVAVDLILANALPIRYRIGVAYLLRDPEKGEVKPYVSIGSSF